MILLFSVVKNKFSIIFPWEYFSPKNINWAVASLPSSSNRIIRSKSLILSSVIGDRISGYWPSGSWLALDDEQSCNQRLFLTSKASLLAHHQFSTSLPLDGQDLHGSQTRWKGLWSWEWAWSNPEGYLCGVSLLLGSMGLKHLRAASEWSQELRPSELLCTKTGCMSLWRESTTQKQVPELPLQVL